MDVKPYAGLVLPDATDMRVSPYFASAKAVLAEIDGQEPRFIPECDLLIGATFGVQIELDEYSDYGPKIVLEVLSSTDEDPEIEAASVLLSSLVERCLEHSPADIIEWQSHDVLIATDDFLRLRGLAPRQVSLSDEDNAQFTATEQIRTALYDGVAIEDSAPPSVQTWFEDRKEAIVATPSETVRMSAASWIMTATIGLFSLPIALPLVVSGLFGNTNLRLAAHLMALTGVFVVLGYA